MVLYVRVTCRKCRTEQDVQAGSDYSFRAPCSNCKQDMLVKITKIDAVVLKPKYGKNGNGGGQ